MARRAGALALTTLIPTSATLASALFRLPIAPDRLSGTLRSVGELEFLQLGGGAVFSDPKTRTASVAAVPLLLSIATAAAFNEAFAQGKAVFGAGEALGTLSFVAQAQ
jgi:hypothetical protein